MFGKKRTIKGSSECRLAPQSGQNWALLVANGAALPKRSCRQLVVPLPEQAQAGIDNLRVVCATASALDLGQCRFDSEFRAVGPMRGHRLDHVRHRHDARLNQDRRALEALRIAAAVHALVVLQRDLGHRPRKPHVLQNVVARLGVLLDQLEFERGEFSGFGQNLRRDPDCSIWEVQNFKGRDDDDVRSLRVSWGMDC